MRVKRFLVVFAANDDIAYAISTASRQERAIPAGAEKPERKPRADARSTSLLAALQREREAGLPGGIYHHVQVDLTYNANHMEGNRLTHD